MLRVAVKGPVAQICTPVGNDCEKVPLGTSDIRDHVDEVVLSWLALTPRQPYAT
jgi:hypothetical protein